MAPKAPTTKASISREGSRGSSRPPSPSPVGPKSRSLQASPSSLADEPGVEREVKAWIARLTKWLPEQRPLSVFVHANPLEALESRHFHAACEAGTRIRGARTTLTATRYRELLAQRRIRGEDVAAALKRIDALGLHRVDDLPRPGPGTILFSTVRPEMAAEVGELVDGFLLRILPAFLDLGSAIWPMPFPQRSGLLSTLRWLAKTPLGVPEPWLSGLGRRLGGVNTTAFSLVMSCLAKRGDSAGAWPNVLHEAMFALPGYAGMIHRLEHVPTERPDGVEVRLMDYLAARLVVEELALLDVARRLFGRGATLETLARSLDSVARPLSRVSWSVDLGAFQDAFEEDYIRSFIGGIVMAAETDRERKPEKVDVQLVVCLDERSESIRRHVEECVPNCETFGTAGFFGVALKHRAPLDAHETLSCPAPVTPTNRVTEKLDSKGEGALTRRRYWHRMVQSGLGADASRSAVRGVLASFASFVTTPRTMLQLLMPELFIEAAHEFEGTELLYRKDVEPEGFTLEEQVSLVRRSLENIGLIDGFARWVLIVGHGSKAVNNQFASGYQCGACGGQRGGINARVFCAFANDPEVRAALSAGGIEVPEETIFLPGEHDTALDQLRWFACERLDEDRTRELDELRGRLKVALERNAKERSRRFQDIPLDASVHDAVRRVRRRCADYAEARPEYNHATNASCLIGRRSLTRGLFLDRRTFLVSYDPTTDDSEFQTLERLMAAPLPVCAGISLEYFFSSMDPQRFGCGTKLPHNVVGLLGVANGSDGDLRPGLWTQTTEIHEPIRLVTVVEAEPEAIASVLERLPAVKSSVMNAWMHLFAYSPSGRGFFRWIGSGFEPYAALPHLLFEVHSSLDACGHTRDSVAPCLIVAPSQPQERGASL